MRTGAAMSTLAYSLRALLLAGSTITATSLALAYAAQLLAVCCWSAGYMHNLRSLALFILVTLRGSNSAELASLMRDTGAPHVNCTAHGEQGSLAPESLLRSLCQCKE